MSTDLHIFHKTVSRDDYKSAERYLNLLYPPEQIAQIIEELKKSRIYVNKVVDILRASGLDLLPIENPNVQQDIHKARKKEKMAPIILVRGNGKVIIADGYHRICAAYYLGEDVEVPFVIA